MSDSQLLAAILAELRELRIAVATRGMPAGDETDRAKERRSGWRDRKSQTDSSASKIENEGNSATESTLSETESEWWRDFGRPKKPKRRRTG